MRAPKYGLGCLLALVVFTTASATPPPPPAFEIVFAEAMEQTKPLEGYWEGRADRYHLALSMVREYGALYIRRHNGGNPWQPLMTLVFDTSSKGYKLMTPKSGGFEVQDVSHPSSNTWVWVTHLDGSAQRMTLTASGQSLEAREDLIDWDGTIKPGPVFKLERMGPGRLTQ